MNIRRGPGTPRKAGRDASVVKVRRARNRIALLYTLFIGLLLVLVGGAVTVAAVLEAHHSDDVERRRRAEGVAALMEWHGSPPTSIALVGPDAVGVPRVGPAAPEPDRTQQSESSNGGLPQVAVVTEGTPPPLQLRRPLPPPDIAALRGPRGLQRQGILAIPSRC